MSIHAGSVNSREGSMEGLSPDLQMLKYKQPVSWIFRGLPLVQDLVRGKSRFGWEKLAEPIPDVFHNIEIKFSAENFSQSGNHQYSQGERARTLLPPPACWASLA